jgi:glutamyl-tRNA reductase
MKALKGILGLDEVVVVATCNRFEVYTWGRLGLDQSKQVLEVLSHFRPVEVSQVNDSTYCYDAEAGLRHLLLVASGADSLIVGELEILNQLKKAQELAMESGTFGLNLGRVFQKALEVGRRSRMETQISRGHLSVSSEAVALAGGILGNWEGRMALVLGSGEMGELTAKVLAKSTNATVVVCNRTAEAARRLADELAPEAQSRCEAAGFENIIGLVQQADVVICATGAPHYILNEQMLAYADINKRSSPLVLLDLSIPRNIDPKCGNIPNVVLKSMEDLQEKAEQTREARLGEVRKVEEIVAEELGRFVQQYRRLPSQELTSELRREIENIRRRHLESYAERFPEEARNYLNTFTQSMVSQILHRLTANLKNVDPSTPEGKQSLEFARELFDLGNESEESTETAKESGCPFHQQKRAV